MDLNEIKKSLYKEKPEANFLQTNNECLLYYCELENGEEISFRIPHSDIGDAVFTPKMQAQLLIRYIWT